MVDLGQYRLATPCRRKRHAGDGTQCGGDRESPKKPCQFARADHSSAIMLGVSWASPCGEALRYEPFNETKCIIGDPRIGSTSTRNNVLRLTTSEAEKRRLADPWQTACGFQ